MRRFEIAIAVVPLFLAGCATSSLELAPASADHPWAAPTNTGGEIISAPADEQQSSGDYALPRNTSLAEIPPPPPLKQGHAYTLAELIDMAQSNNPATRIAWDDARNAALATGIAKSAYLPRLTGSVIGGYQTGHGRNAALSFGAGSDVTSNGSISSLSLEWLLFDFGKRSATVEAAEQGSVGFNIAFTAAHQQVIYKVSLAFYARAAAESRAEAATKALKNAQDIQAAAEARFKHGVATVIEVSQARQGTAQARFALVEAQGAAQNAYLNLLAAMGISPLTAITIADVGDRKLTGAMMQPVERIVSQALTRRPDMLTAYAAHRASLAGLRAAEAEYLPKFFVSATGSYATGGLAVTALPGIGQEAPTVNLSNHQWGATILAGVRVPIYDGGLRDALVEQARTDSDKTDAALRQVRDEAIREIVSAGNAVKTSLAAYEASNALVSAAQTTFNAALAAYRQGVGSITDLTLAESQLLQAKNAETDAYSNALSAAATLALSAGALTSAPP